MPPSFGDAQRVSLQRAVFLAGMHPGRFVSAPQAAAVGAIFDAPKAALASGDKAVAVNVGASSMDVQLLNCTGPSSFEAVATSGDSHAGGIDMDHLLARTLQVGTWAHAGYRSVTHGC